MTERQVSHGVLAGYSRGCRCDACRQAKREYNKADKARRFPPKPKVELAHGTLGRFNKGCRCEPCVLVRKEYVAEHYRRNRDLYKQRAAQWAKDNPERAKENSAVGARRRREIDKAASLRKEAEEREKNRERIRATSRASEARRFAANPAKIKAERAAKFARRRNAKADGWTDEYITILVGDPCCFCGAPCENIDHIIPISRGGTSESVNLAATCKRCNVSKGAKSLLEFMLWKVNQPVPELIGA